MTFIKQQEFLLLRFIEMMAGISITACGLSCMIKSGLGQTAITAFTQNITMITHMKSGTVLFVFFVSCTVLQMLLLGKKFEKIQLLQVVIAFVQGKLVNVICYDIPKISMYYPANYYEQWIILLIGIFLASYGVAIVFKVEFIRNPFEELAMVLSKKLNIEFSIFRVRIDMFFLVISVLMILLFHLDFTTIREGTWVSMMLLGRSMKYTFVLAERTSIYCRKMKSLG